MDTESNPVLALSRNLDAYRLDRFRLLCTGVDIRTELNGNESNDQFGTLLRRLKQNMQNDDEAVLFCCQILEQLNYKRTENFRKTANPITDYDFRKSYPEVDCMLTVLKFVDVLRPRDYSSLLSQICESTSQSPDRVQNKPDLVRIMFDENIASVDNMSSVLKLAGQFNRSWMFDDFVKRNPQCQDTNVPGYDSTQNTNIRCDKKKRCTPKQAAYGTGVIIAIALSLCFVIFLVAWLWYSKSYGLLYFGLSSFTKYIGGCVISLLGCFNPAYTKRVVVPWLGDGDYQYSLYLVLKTALHVEQNTLNCGPSHLDNNPNQALNCFFGDRPIHATEKGGTVSYNMTAICHDASLTSSCQFILYQFILDEAYMEYTGDSNKVVPEQFQQSKVRTAKLFPTSYQIDFELLEGFNYFAVYINTGVELLNATISGYSTFYSITNTPSPEKCSIESSQCTVVINDHPDTVPDVIGQEEICLIAKPDQCNNVDSIPITVTPYNFSVNGLSLVLILFCFVCLLSSLAVISTSIGIYCYKKHC